MNLQTAAPKNGPRILCIGMPVRDLTFRIQELPERGFKVNATHFDEISGGNAFLVNKICGVVIVGCNSVLRTALHAVGKKKNGNENGKQQRFFHVLEVEGE